MINLSCDYCEAKITGTPDDFRKLTVFDEVSLNGKKVVVNYNVTASCGHICLSCAQEAVGILIRPNEQSAPAEAPEKKTRKPKRALTIDELT
jgi:hypothetical protein